MAISRKNKKRGNRRNRKSGENGFQERENFRKEECFFWSYPHITRKRLFLSEKNAYVFKIEPEFNKIMVRQAVKKQYNVEPRKVRIINIPGKWFLSKEDKLKSRLQKAIVYLKKAIK